jgi:hypothetical protein
MQKLYAYVDEAGQHTKGKLFVVSVVIVGGEGERERLAGILDQAEKSSGKRRQKWRTSKHEERLAYFKTVLTNPAFKGRLLYSRYRASRAYVDLTVRTVSVAIMASVKGEYKATILVDGLRKPERQAFAVSLRKRGIRTEKVRGIDDEKDAFIRLADALCGMIVDVDEGIEGYAGLFKKALHEGVIVELP